MDTWDSDVGIETVSIIKNKWEGEDVEEDVVESWDQEPEEEKDEIIKPVVTAPPKKNNLKKLGEKLEEKEKRKKQVKSSKDGDSDDSSQKTPEELLAEKLKRQKLQEESDLSLAKEVFGVLSNGLETKEDYDKLKEELMKLLSDGVKNTNFVNFTEELIHSLCVHLSSADLKKIHTWVGNLHIEKNKMEKGEKSKKSKGKGKAKLKLEGNIDYSEYSAYTEDFEDFI